MRWVGRIPGTHRGTERVLVDRLHRVEHDLARLRVVSRDHAVQVLTDLNAVRVRARAEGAPLPDRAGLGHSVGVATEDTADASGGRLRIEHQTLLRVRLEHVHRTGGATEVRLR